MEPDSNNEINVYGDGCNVLTQIDTNASSQCINVENGIDFEKVLELFEHIQINLKSFDLAEDAQKKLTKIIEDTLPQVKMKNDSPLIGKALSFIHGVLINIPSNVAARLILHSYFN